MWLVETIELSDPKDAYTNKKDYFLKKARLMVKLLWAECSSHTQNVHRTEVSIAYIANVIGYNH